jgi:hypothetical protein
MAIRWLVAATLPWLFACSLACVPENLQLETANCPTGGTSSAPAALQSARPSVAAPATSGSAATEGTALAVSPPVPLLPPAPDPEPPLLGAIGDLPLESGETIKDCQVEYRVLGTPNADKSNIVVWTTWFSGITKDLVELVVLVVVNEHDAMVTPGPALDFAKRANASVLTLKGDCGHRATGCEEKTIAARVARFLQ